MIQNSAQGVRIGGLSIDLHNTGSMPERVTWTIDGPNYSNSHLGVTSGSPDMHTAVDPFAPGATLHYDGLGFQIADPTQPGDPNHGHPLDNYDLGKTFTATYTATCGEHRRQRLAHSYVGFASGPTTSALTSRPGLPSGDLAVVMTTGSSTSNNPGCPSGYTQANHSVALETYLCSHILIAGDMSVPATTKGNYKSVAVYRGATGIGANTYAGTTNGLPPESVSYPHYAPSLGAWNCQVLTQDRRLLVGRRHGHRYRQRRRGPSADCVQQGSLADAAAAGSGRRRSRPTAPPERPTRTWAPPTPTVAWLIGRYRRSACQGGWVTPNSSTTHQTETVLVRDPLAVATS